MFTSISCFQWFVTVILLCIKSWNIINSFNIATFKTQNNKHVLLCYALLYFTNSHFNWLYPFFEVFLIFEKVLKLNCSIFFFKGMGVLSLGKRVRGIFFSDKGSVSRFDLSQVSFSQSSMLLNRSFICHTAYVYTLAQHIYQLIR